MREGGIGFEKEGEKYKRVSKRQLITKKWVELAR